MNNSKPGQKLDPALKAIIDPVYESNKTRYANICRWVWWAQRQGWPDETIGKAVELAGDRLHTVDNWWAFLTRLLPKASGRAHEDEAQRYKREEMNFLSSLLGPNWSKKRDEKKARPPY